MNTEQVTSGTEKKSKQASFVKYVSDKSETDKGFAARMRRADNPATEYQSWDTLAYFKINIEFESERLAYSLIAASIARCKSVANGKLPFGSAIAQAFPNGKDSDQAQMRLRRVLACNSTVEVVRILRPMITLIQSRVKIAIDYVSLLSDLTWFENDPQRIKARWAQQFYHTLSPENKTSKE